MGSVPRKVANRLSKEVKVFQGLLEQARGRDVAESRFP